MANISIFFRYTPNTLSLAVHELDEKHIGAFSLRTHEGLFQVWHCYYGYCCYFENLKLRLCYVFPFYGIEVVVYLTCCRNNAVVTMLS